jgi:pimeloyl-ACP methyl ester carboxylesterase
VNYHLNPVVSVYDRLVWAEGQIERLLASGERRRELIAYLGAEEYAALRPMAQAAAAARRDPDCSVYLIPGIMGSQLGIRRAAPLPANLLWIDPADFQLGGLLAMRLPEEHIVPFGPVIYSYLRLKFALEIAGFNVRYFDYDWRRSVDALGAQLAGRLAKDPAKRLLLVGHSMGGLVARAALFGGDPRIARLVTLGTPHGGSFAPLQALRGVYGTVRRLAQLDPAHSAEELAAQVFTTFPSLYQMLPEQLLDAASWPDTAPRPDAALLAAARRLALPAPPDRLLCIAGHGTETVTGASHDGTQFHYVITHAGDGTVPSAAAQLAQCRCWYTTVGHSDLPRDTQLATAVVDLLRNGDTPHLTTHVPDTVATSRGSSDAALRRTFTNKLDWARLTAAGRHEFLDALNAPVDLAP